MASFLSGQDSGVLVERGWDGEMEGGGVGEHGCVGGHRCAGDYGMVGGGGRLGGVGGNGCDAAQLFGRAGGVTDHMRPIMQGPDGVAGHLGWF